MITELGRDDDIVSPPHNLLLILFSGFCLENVAKGKAPDALITKVLSPDTGRTVLELFYDMLDRKEWRKQIKI